MYDPAVPSFDGLDPLAPDACQSDPHAVCRYWHTKVKALNGQRDELSQRDLAWSGAEIGWRSPGRGWRSPELPPAALSDLDDVPDVDPSLARALSRLSSAQQMDFLA